MPAAIATSATTNCRASGARQWRGAVHDRARAAADARERERDAGDRRRALRRRVRRDRDFEEAERERIQHRRAEHHERAAGSAARRASIAVPRGTRGASSCRTGGARTKNDGADRSRRAPRAATAASGCPIATHSATSAGPSDENDFDQRRIDRVGRLEERRIGDEPRIERAHARADRRQRRARDAAPSRRPRPAARRTSTSAASAISAAG